MVDYIDIYLKEDLGEEGDITTNSIFRDEEGEAVIIAKEDCVLAGIDDAGEVFSRLGAIFEKIRNDGDVIKKGEIVAKVKGKLRSILAGERLALNMISRMSGIASETKTLVDMCRKVNLNVRIAATRKTTPGFRKYEKKAIIIGGGDPHRFGLFDAVLIKDNHIKAAGSIREAIKRVKEKVADKFIEIEVENEEQALIAVDEGVNAVLIDNQPPQIAERIARMIKERNPDILVEVSGGIKKDNILDYARFADRISLGYLTHSVRSKDFSLELDNQN